MTKNSRGSIAPKAFKAICIVFVLSISQISVFADEIAQNSSSENQTEQASKFQSVPQNSQGPSESQGWNWNSGDYEQTPQPSSTFGLFVKMVLSLAVVLGLAYLAMRILRRGAKIRTSADPFLRHVSHLPLSSNRSVDVVTILNHAYIIGVSDNSVNLIGQIEDEELVNSMNLYADKTDNSKRPRSFDDILSIFMPGGSGKNQNVYGSSAQNAAESLERQRNRLNGEV
jgi:flagellar protein FliO/FliZ